VIQGHRPIVLKVQHSTTLKQSYSSDNKGKPCLYNASKWLLLKITHPEHLNASSSVSIHNQSNCES